MSVKETIHITETGLKCVAITGMDAVDERERERERERGREREGEREREKRIENREKSVGIIPLGLLRQN